MYQLALQLIRHLLNKELSIPVGFNVLDDVVL